MHLVDGCILFNNIILYVMLLVIILVEIFSIQGWTKTIRELLVSNEIDTLQLRTQATADLASVKFLDMASDISLIRNITQHVMNNSMAAKPTFTPENYYNAENYTLQGLVGEPGSYKFHSGWYNHASNDPDSVLNANLNKTALFRHPWQAVSDNWLAQGFGDTSGFVRFFPLAHNSGFPTRSYTCVSNDERNGQTVTGYDPRCRAWYKAAQDEPSAIIYSSPYEDALSGGWVITLSTAVLNVKGGGSSTATGSSLAGCLFSDVSMASLQSFFTEMDGDHTFLIDDVGNVVVHNIFDNGATLQQRLFPFSVADQNTFENTQLKLMTSAASSTSGSVSYTYNSRQFVGGYARVAGTKYTCGILIDQGPIYDRIKVAEENGDSKIFIICYLISYFALYSMAMGTACCGLRPKSGVEGFLKIGLPQSFLFICLLAISLPLSFVANAGLIGDFDELLTAQTKDSIRQLSVSNGEWLTGYLQSAWYRHLQPMYHTTSRLSVLAADIQSNVSYQDDTLNSALLSPPLVSDVRLVAAATTNDSSSSSNSRLVSMSSTSWFVTGTTASQATTLNSSMVDLIDTSQLTTQYSRSLYTTTLDFVLTYVGFSSKLFRKYPGSVSSDLSYDPTTRDWYGLAQNSSSIVDDSAALPYSSSTQGYTSTVYSPAYKDAFSGEWMITAARSTADKTAVIGADLLLATITDIFTNIKFFRTGRATLFDFEDDYVIADRDLKLTSQQTAPYSYTEMKEPPISASLFAQMKKASEVGPAAVEGSDGVEYYIYSRKLTDANLGRYGIMTAVPVSEAREAVEPTLDRIRAASVSVGLGLGVTCFFVIIFILVSSALATVLGRPGGQAEVTSTFSAYDKEIQQEEVEDEGSLQIPEELKEDVEFPP